MLHYTNYTTLQYATVRYNYATTTLQLHYNYTTATLQLHYSYTTTTTH